jgi:Peroxidase, family 2
LRHAREYKRCFTRSSVLHRSACSSSKFIEMLSNTFAPLLSALLLALTVQGLPQLEDTSADGPPRAPPQLVLDVPNPPPPHTFTGAMLVNDAAHPYRAPRAGDLRGPCPGLNTLANHGVSDFLFNFNARWAPYRTVRSSGFLEMALPRPSKLSLLYRKVRLECSMPRSSFANGPHNDDIQASTWPVGQHVVQHTLHTY